MAAKKIRLELDAGERLRRARWPRVPMNAGQLLKRLSALAIRHPEILLAPAVLDQMEQRRRAVRRKSGSEKQTRMLLDACFPTELPY